ncbi:secreted Ly-6/uPAR-related protein 1-like [Bufo bufo]|uniref:secreted Ly-6/uPAR-related protein 1-like n=1 Tax=Bufo bufo TaxID=8384 RepID=UPI001ABE554F|nr:secreted Ly-6/uPAR-related protein 1-like [Bufo bufo]
MSIKHRYLQEDQNTPRNLRTMRASAFFYLVAAAAFACPIAHGLQCYLCQSPTAALQCTTTTNCTNEETWCYTTVYGPAAYPFKENRIVVRGCAKDCTSSNPNNLGVTRPTICCQYDLCNVLSKALRTELVTRETVLLGIAASTILQHWA